MKTLTIYLFLLCGALLAADSGDSQSKKELSLEKTRQVEVEKIQKKGSAPFYVLNVGDSLRINIYGREASERIVVIDNHGQFNYLYLGTVDAANMTIPMLQKSMTEKMQKLYKHAIVLVSPVNLQSRSYVIAGMLNAPGRKAIVGNATLLSALASAGGLLSTETEFSTIDRADLERSFLVRNGKRVGVNFQALIYEGQLKYNIPVESGDFIYISDSNEKKIYVLGAVAQPFEFEVMRRSSLLQVLSHAGGLSPNAGSEAVIIRGSLDKPEVARVNIDEILEGERSDVYIKANDLVYIPEKEYLFGEELLELAIRTFVLRLAAESGSEAFDKIQETDGDNDNDFIIGI